MHIALYTILYKLYGILYYMARWPSTYLYSMLFLRNIKFMLLTDSMVHLKLFEKSTRKRNIIGPCVDEATVYGNIPLNVEEIVNIFIKKYRSINFI